MDVTPSPICTPDQWLLPASSCIQAGHAYKETARIPSAIRVPGCTGIPCFHEGAFAQSFADGLTQLGSCECIVHFSCLSYMVYLALIRRQQPKNCPTWYVIRYSPVMSYICGCRITRLSAEGRESMYKTDSMLAFTEMICADFAHIVMLNYMRFGATGIPSWMLGQLPHLF